MLQTLPEALLLYLIISLPSQVLAQTQIPLNSVISLTPQNLSSSTTEFRLPSSENLTISIASCLSSSKFFISNSTSEQSELELEDGIGVFSGRFVDGGTLTVEGIGEMEIGASNNGPLHEYSQSLPMLGDTTANQAILFSAPFQQADINQPQYPNYTLSVPSKSEISVTPPATTPNFTLVIQDSQTSTAGCLVTSSSSSPLNMSGTIVNSTLWLRDAKEGWRMQWLVGGLTPSTNYTAYVIQGGKNISGPIRFLTKSASFSCPLVSSLPYCPGISYAVPLPQPDPPTSTYDHTNLPDTIQDPIIEYLTNFTISLTTFACGRDWYSPLKTCADCQNEYRKWLCTISFPRCGEASPTSTSSESSSSTPGTQSRSLFARLIKRDGSDSDNQKPLPVSALTPVPTSAPPRNTAFPPFNETYNVLLPCLETCNAADRACPASLGFKCPIAKFGAAQTYGVGIIDGSEDDQQGMGSAGISQDRWGNVWCNAG
ncbi:stretch-activated cation channel mid1 [Paramarasmius palmivorus]|uniref:Stretch-activated cation channel mid1 n=1 Tax=Paramarasmius palmivorus TaxID=297713 RepID=A0AAW0D4Q5_9AGAR